MLSTRILSAIAQVLSTLSASSANVLLVKHLNDETHTGADARAFLRVLKSSEGIGANNLLVELIENAAVRVSASPKYAFDATMQNLRGWMAYEGWEVTAGALVANAPAIEDSTQLRERLLERLAQSEVDADGCIRAAVDASARHFSTEPIDVNASTGSIRIALETCVRRSAVMVATSRSVVPPEDVWGSALAFLRQQEILTLDEERGIAAAYTFISPSAHLPKGIDDIEWARIVRTVALSICYFVTFVVPAI